MHDTKYDNKEKCQKCGSQNNITEKAIDGWQISECETECQKCGYSDYWSYGFYNYEPR